jgi:hypothetical protein
VIRLVAGRAELALPPGASVVEATRRPMIFQIRPAVLSIAAIASCPERIVPSI